MRLSIRLAAGLQGMEDERKRRHAEFVESCQHPDGGFCGRDGGSDLYYTSFAVRALAAVDGISEQNLVRVAEFLRNCGRRQTNVVDVLSWLYCVLVVEASGGSGILDHGNQVWCDRLAQMLETLRADDGGYSKSPEGTAGSTYQSFLVALCYEMIDRPIPQPDRLVAFLNQRQREDGGFVEIAPMTRSGTNPTAAAVALLKMLGAIDDDLQARVCEFLFEVKSPDGGFQANTRIPFGDSLSTFTAVLTAQDLDIEEVIDFDELESFIGRLEFPTGGFRGAEWDTQADVEYTFYALGTLALLWSKRSGQA